MSRLMYTVEIPKEYLRSAKRNAINLADDIITFFYISSPSEVLNFITQHRLRKHR